MKRLRFFSIFLTAVTFMMLALTCTEEGGIGPQGIPGEAGQKGALGDRGATGTKGANGDRGDTGPGGAKGAKGDRGATGAAGAPGQRGPEGTRGDAGRQGPAGPTGAQGAVGVGNVIYSGWIRPTADDLTANGEIELITPKLTSAILNTGEVYIYLRDAYDQSAQVFPLEGYSHSYYSFRFSPDVGRILIYTVAVLAKGGDTPPSERLVPCYASYGLQDPDPILDYEYRYVFIPGGTKSSLKINPTDYRSMRQKLGLTEPSFDKSI